MKRHLTRLLLIVGLVIVTALFSSAYAADIVAEGTCGAEGDGSNLTWTLDSDGVLTISGEGAMADYTLANIPWLDHRADITSVHAGDGVTVIGTYAFARCSNLETIRLPKSLTAVNRYAFYNCSSLASVDYDGTELLKENIEIAENNEPLLNVTWDCVEFADVNKSGSCGENVSYTIYNDGLLLIEGSGQMKDYKSVDGMSGSYTDTPWERYSIKKVIIKEGVTSIGDLAFCSPAGSSLTYIIIPESVTSIGKSAFFNCHNLTSITIPDSVTSIGNGAFNMCSSIPSISIPDGVASIGDNTFSGCTSLMSITVPGSVTSIGNSAFCDCSNLANLIIQEGVTSIGNEAFRGCSSLTSITIPDSVTSIRGRAFCGCSSLTSITIPDSITSIAWDTFSGCSSLTSITIPDSVTSIDDSAFYGCSSLISITIPDSVTSIGRYAFYGCSSLTSITIPDSVTSIDDCAFQECSGLTRITIGNGVTSIGSSLFRGCSSLTSITIPDSVTSIAWNAFYGCSSLASITIPDSVTFIGGYAFYGCSSLTSITIPDSATSILDSTFSGCGSLTNITLSNIVLSIGANAFSGCSDLTDVYYSGNEEEWNSIVINANNDWLTSATIHYNYVYLVSSEQFGVGLSCARYSDGTLVISGNGIMLDYQAAGSAPWDNKANRINRIIVEEGVQNVSAGAFDGFSNLRSAVITDSVVSIGDYAFSECDQLTEVEMCSGVEAIGEAAFFGCSSLNLIRIPASVTEIKDDAFGACDALSDVCYLGTAEEWASISIGSGNEALAAADKHLGSDWTYTGFDWDKDGTGKVYAVFICSKCGHTGYIPAEVTQSEGVLTATAEFNGVNYTDSRSGFATITNCKLELAGKISIRMYFRAPETAKTAKLFFEDVTTHSYPETPAMTLSLARTGNPNYSASQDLFIMTFPRITSKDMTRLVKLVICDEDDQPMWICYEQGNTYHEDGFEYCAADWANRILNKTDSTDAAKFMAKALLNYGGHAQKYLSNFNPDHPANPSNYLAEEMAALQADPANTKEISSDAELYGYVRTTLQLSSDTDVRIYFNKDVKVWVDGKEAKVNHSGSTWLVVISGITSRQLDHKFDITVECEDVTWTMRYCALSWANDQIANGNENSMPTAKALYLYNQAAKAYLK